MLSIKATVFVLTLLSLWSCTDNSGSPPVQPSPTAVTQLKVFGILMSSLEDWEITAREYRGEIYGSDQTLFVGRGDVYSINSLKTDQQELPVPTLLEIEKGRYREVVGNSYHELVAGDKLLSYINVRGVNQEQANISYLSTVAAGLLEYRSATNGLGDIYNIIASNEDFTNYIGFDILTTDFVDTTDVSNQPESLTNELKHGLLHAAISQWTYDLSIAAGNTTRVEPYTTVNFITTAYQDIVFDGFLNGIGANGQPLFLGSELIDETSYSHKLAISMMKYMEDSDNKITLSKKDILDFAVFLNDKNNTISIDEGGPIVTQFRPLDGSTISGNQEFVVNVQDLTGIQAIEFLIDGIHYSNYGFLGSSPLVVEGNSLFFVPVFQPSGTIGTHSVTVKVTNIFGTVTEVTNDVVFDNS